MRKIIISAGHGGADPGASSNGFIERDLALDLRNLIVIYLKNTYGVTALIDPPQNKLAETLAWLRGKFTSKDILFDIHWNAGGGTGIEAIIPDVFSHFERSLAQTIVDKISALTTWKRRQGGVKRESETPRKKLGWMRPYAENVLLEVCFIDNKLDMAIYQANRQGIAKIIGDTLYKFSKQ